MRNDYAKGRITRPPGQGRHLPLPLSNIILKRTKTTVDTVILKIK